MSSSIYDRYFDWRNNPADIVKMKKLIVGSHDFEPDTLANSIHEKIVELNKFGVLTL
jgi:hypothetical protein